MTLVGRTPQAPCRPVAASRRQARGWRGASRLIDRELARSWRKRGITPAPESSDAAFLRRVSLDLIGRIPTRAEAAAFLADRSPKKREVLVDRLLASDEHAAYFAEVYLTLLVGNTRRIQPVYRHGPLEYLVHVFADNVPYDRFARELLTATGPVYRNGAAVFAAAALAKNRSVDDVAGKAAELFLGIQIKCARCHDDPYDKRYKKETFKTFAAFFGHMTAKRRVTAFGPQVDIEDNMRTPPSLARVKERKPGILRRHLLLAATEPRFLGRKVPPLSGETRRQTLARAIIGSDLFAKEAVNRSWALLFGRGIVSPTADLGGEHDPKQPPLLCALAREFRRSGYNERRLLKAIVMSKAYGRSSRGGGGAPARVLDAAFARSAVRPMSPDQMFWSEAVATGSEGSPPTEARPRLRPHLELRYLKTFPYKPGGPPIEANIVQALLLRNGPLTNRSVRVSRRSVLGQIIRETRDPERRLDAMFVAAYSRHPTAAERRRFGAFLARHRGDHDAYEDLYHAMLTSTEFVTNH